MALEIIKWLCNSNVSSKKMKIQFLPAECGDAIILCFQDKTGTEHLIVTDFGKEKFKGQKLLISRLDEEIRRVGLIDLFIVTHMDNDHIGGAISLFKNDFKNITDNVTEWWLNHSVTLSSHSSIRRVNAKQAVELKESLTSIGKCPQMPILAGDEKLIGDAKIIVLSPDLDSYNKAKNITLTEENKRQRSIGAKLSDHQHSIDELISRPFELDCAPANRSSISFLFEALRFKGLFLADSAPDIIVKELMRRGYSIQNKLKVDLIKVSHHGSRKNTSNELLILLECTNFVISSNGINGNSLPDKEALSRIIQLGTKKKPVNIFFTYDDRVLRSIFSEKEKKDSSYYFKLHFSKNILTYPFSHDIYQ